jgi:hypothetical protein
MKWSQLSSRRLVLIIWYQVKSSFGSGSTVAEAPENRTTRAVAWAIAGNHKNIIIIA